MTHNYPNIADLRELASAVKRTIDDDYRASDDPDDDTPGISLTVGASEDGEWSYQTGDNSFSGGAYFYPHWAIVGIYRDSNCLDVAHDIQNQLRELY